MRAEPALVDTCILLDATNTARSGHAAATAVLETHRALVMSAQIAREYLVVATRPINVNGLGMEIKDAMANLDEIRTLVRMLPEERPLLGALLTLLKQIPCHGKIIHDAWVVATLRVHRIKNLITANPKDFERFGNLVRVLEPSASNLGGTPGPTKA